MEDDPPYQISISVETDLDAPPDEELVRAVAHTLRRHHCPTADISIALVDDAQIATLNEQYLGHEGPTDVLSFELGDSATQANGQCRSVDGEIVISLETAAREGAGRGHTATAEALLYAIHGTLHLLGYLDDDAEQAATMHRLEDAILAEIGVGPVYEGGCA